MAIYPELVVVTRDESVPVSLLDSGTDRIRRGQTTEIDDADSDVVARLLYEGLDRTDDEYLPDRYRFRVEIRIEAGIERFATWLAESVADEPVMLHLDDEGVDATRSALRSALREQWSSSGTRTIDASVSDEDDASSDAAGSDPGDRPGRGDGSSRSNGADRTAE